ncbi:MAG: hypothetical protein Q9222_001970 [Ikaeria aurantiellina]
MSGFTIFFKHIEGEKIGTPQDCKEGISDLVRYIVYRAMYHKNEEMYEHWQKGIDLLTNTFTIQETSDAASAMDLSEAIQIIKNGFATCRNDRESNPNKDLIELFSILWKIQDLAGVPKRLDDPSLPAPRSIPVDPDLAVRPSPYPSITKPHNVVSAPGITAQFNYKSRPRGWINPIPFPERLADIEFMLERKRDLEFQLNVTDQRLKHYFREFRVMFCSMHDPRPTVPEITGPLYKASEEYRTEELEHMMIRVSDLARDARKGGEALQKWEADQRKLQVSSVDNSTRGGKK